tara:strand:+ start:211 stop:531 length:321 start_codon:yes stop_codon:yes gene_type:complete
MRIKPPTLGEKIAMTLTNDNAPITDATTLVARLEEHSDFANKVMRDLLREASDRIQILTRERNYYEMFYEEGAVPKSKCPSTSGKSTEDIINDYKHGTGWGKGKDE